MDLMLAMAFLPGWAEGTAMGAIGDDWRERCRGMQERKRGKRGDGETRETTRLVFMRTHVHFTEIPFKHPLPKTESPEGGHSVSHVVPISPILTFGF